VLFQFVTFYQVSLVQEMLRLFRSCKVILGQEMTGYVWLFHVT